ncbi:MAG: ATP-dependent Clp protease ATP-binding subunit, partial [Clostridia bacterium]|nr:ATP-dependent Clp protease ATP-binding subunit [Clostridia bacterium]
MLYAILESDTCYAVKILRQLGVDIARLKESTLGALKTFQDGQDDLGYAMYFSDSEDPSSQPSGTSFSSQGERNASERNSGGGTPNTGSEAERRKQAEQRYNALTKSGLFDGAEARKKAVDKLSAYGIDMTERAKRGKLDPVIGRQKEIEKVVQVLSRRSKNNPVLVGEPGVGKSAIAEGLAQLIVQGDVPEQLYNKTVFSVDIPGMLAGARYRGDFEERLKDLVDTVMEDGDIVLFIDEIHNIVGAGASSDSSMDAANILKPMLARGDLQVIGATT